MPITTIIKPDSPDFYADAARERKPNGVIFVDGRECASTLLCPHCGMHFVSRKGSGANRVFCAKCNAVTCGKPTCCNHAEYFMQTIDRIEAEARRGY